MAISEWQLAQSQVTFLTSRISKRENNWRTSSESKAIFRKSEPLEVEQFDLPKEDGKKIMPITLRVDLKF